MQPKPKARMKIMEELKLSIQNRDEIIEDEKEKT
jgi:hypothetical protein